MNNKMSSKVLPILFLIAALPIAQTGYADDSTVYTTTPVNQLGDGEVSSAAMAKYLYNLGGELGFDLKNAVSTPISTLLLNPPTILESIAAATLITMMGAIPVDASPLNPSLANFVPSNNATYTAFNSLANNTFLSYSSPAGTSSGATVSPLIDQQTYQSDPVSQFILNLMSTPNRTYCMDGTGTKWLNNNSQKIGDCDYLYDNKILNNVVGSIPATPFLPPNTKNPIIKNR
jgi:intracellular multiplication protein IcmX